MYVVAELLLGDRTGQRGEGTDRMLGGPILLPIIIESH